ncbi:endonuclease III [bacterium]|nr:endonuclease III [bacterium]|tara:strand:+ start:3182 stop:3820 length:639 start_codon:yes stop_codon:yes gene_type:complete
MALVKSNNYEKKRAQQLLRALKKLFPHPKMVLKYSNNWELLVAVVLSAQCTDKKVNEVTAELFKKYKTLDDYVRAKRIAFERDIRPTGFYRNKAKNILTSAKIVKKEYDGKVPNTMEEILKLPGVARKTANIVLGNAFGVVEGIAVDTHVKRLSRRFGLANEQNPEKIEKDLMRLFPKKEWLKFNHRMIEYGRNYCSARSCPKDHPLHRFDK